jgi:hypothetical protein
VRDTSSTEKRDTYVLLDAGFTNRSQKVQGVQPTEILLAVLKAGIIRKLQL